MTKYFGLLSHLTAASDISALTGCSYEEAQKAWLHPETMTEKFRAKVMADKDLAEAITQREVLMRTTGPIAEAMAMIHADESNRVLQ
jgi:hypothetical protein